MPTVTFLPKHVTVEVAYGSGLLSAARRAHVNIESPCNGGGTCEKCKVRILAGEVNPEYLLNHANVLTEVEKHNGWLLSCLVEVTSDLCVEISEHSDSDNQILSEGVTHQRQLRPWVTKHFDVNDNKTRILSGHNIIAEEPGDVLDIIYGIAVDIGTTTIVVSLVNLITGEELGVASAINPQTVFGHDVLSRIKFAGENDGLRKLQEGLIETLNKLIFELADKHYVTRERIYEAVFSGNTTMLHLAVAANPRSLGRYPYTPLIHGGTSLPAVSIGLQIAANGEVYLPPIFDAFVGADITSGVLATALNQLSGVTLFVDVGTNGEMILAVNGQLHATSTAAGPAFEGMNISCGMRAANGAIDMFKIDDDGVVDIRTIGRSEAAGICGSGLIDIVGELVISGVIDKSGRFTKSREDLPYELKHRLTERDGKTLFDLGNNVYLSQKDIRQVQLAKGAIRAGIDALIQLRELKPNDVDTVLIAGSFGYHLRPESLINLGLLPVAFADKIKYVGNTSKTGAIAFLLDRNAREELFLIVQSTPTIDLAHSPNFDKIFVDALAFPMIDDIRVAASL